MTHDSQCTRRHRKFQPQVESLEDRCNPDGSFGAWSAPVNLGSGINTASSDQHPAISKDGLSLYITTNRPENADDLVLDDNIWVCQRASVDDNFGSPVLLGPAINSGSNDRVPTFSRDGHWMYFGSNRTRPDGTAAGLDLWRSYRQDVHDDFAWQAAELVPGVNSSGDDDGPTLFSDDETGVTTLYFTSARPQPDESTDFDIYSCTQNSDGSFTAPVNVAELNSTGRDTRTALRHDGREIFITSDRADLPGSQGLIDLWVSTRATTSDPWSTPVNLGPTVNSSANDGAPAISSDSQTLYFYSNRSSGSGGNDLYTTTREKVPGGGSNSGSIAAVLPKGAGGAGRAAVMASVPSGKLFVAPGVVTELNGDLAEIPWQPSTRNGTASDNVHLPPAPEEIPAAAGWGLTLHADEIAQDDPFAEDWLLGLRG